MVTVAYVKTKKSIHLITGRFLSTLYMSAHYPLVTVYTTNVHN